MRVADDRPLRSPSPTEHKILKGGRRHSSAQSLALRCRIILGCADGKTDRESRQSRVHPSQSEMRHRC